MSTSQHPYDDPRIESVLLSEAQIAARIRELAQDICAHYVDAKPLRLVGVLKGAFVFLADLAREIRRQGGPPVVLDVARASTYADGMKAIGEVARDVTLALMPDNLHHCDVLIVEDILDQGFTLNRILNCLDAESGARSVGCCVLLDKQLEAPTADVAAARRLLAARQPLFRGFEIPDRWVAGYGLDVGEEFRDLPEVVVVDESCFRE